MATFVLVHGAWHGGWCWQRVTPLLRAAGHAVYVPTLTGLGERGHLLSPEIDLATHASDVVGLLEYEELEQVVLVGHSYGGIVITAVAEQAPGRLAHLVYLDAFVPRDGECLLDFLGETGRTETLERARSQGEGWYLPPRERESAFGVTDPADAAWVNRKLSPMPLRPMTQPLPLVNLVAAALPRTFIECMATRWFTRFAERARTEPGWRYREVPTGHDAMISLPLAVVDLLLEVASAPQGGS